MRDEPRVSVDIARRAIRSTEYCQSDLVAPESMLPRSGSDSSLKRNSNSGFVDVTERAVRQVHGLSQFAGEVR